MPKPLHNEFQETGMVEMEKLLLYAAGSFHFLPGNSSTLEFIVKGKVNYHEPIGGKLGDVRGKFVWIRQIQF